MYFFQAGASVNIETYILARLGHFWLFCHGFMHSWCPFYRPKECGGAPKLTNMRYASAREPLAFVFLEIMNMNLFNTGESPVEIGFYRQEILNI